MRQDLTPSQTVGPFPHEAWQWAVQASTLAGEAALTIEGRLLDGQGEPVNDGWIEAWMPAADGLGAAGLLPNFRRLPTDAQGGFSLQLAAAPAAGEPAAYITVFARGLALHQQTALFIDEAAPLLLQVPAERRATLLATRVGPQRWHWDIRLQAEDANDETVFFDYL